MSKLCVALSSLASDLKQPQGRAALTWHVKSVTSQTEVIAQQQSTGANQTGQSLLSQILTLILTINEAGTLTIIQFSLQALQWSVGHTFRLQAGAVGTVKTNGASEKNLHPSPILNLFL